MRLSYIRFKALEKFSDGTSADEIASDAHGEIHLDGMLVLDRTQDPEPP